jgi:hypothetical protein
VEFAARKKLLCHWQQLGLTDHEEIASRRALAMTWHELNQKGDHFVVALDTVG